MVSSRAVRLVQQVRATREHLWKACATPDGMASWQADQVTGRVEVGQSIVMEWPALGAQVVLEIVQVRRPERLVMRNGDTRVVLEIEDGSVTLTHDGIGPDDDRPGFAASWRVTLALLAHAVERHGARPRRTHWWLRPVKTTPESAYALFTTRAGLGAWLAISDDLGPIGSAYEMATRDGPPLSGRVLANIHSRDVALSCDAAGGAALQLRTLPSPRSDDERLVAIVWSDWGTRHMDGTMERTLGSAFDRLCAALARGGQA